MKFEWRFIFSLCFSSAEYDFVVAASLSLCVCGGPIATNDIRLKLYRIMIFTRRLSCSSKDLDVVSICECMGGTRVEAAFLLLHHDE